MTQNVLEFVDHLHEHFPFRCSINSQGRYNVPQNPDEGYSIEIFADSKDIYRFPNGSYWSSEEAIRVHRLKEKELSGKRAPGGSKLSNGVNGVH
jgi:L-fuconate dehydratase